MVLHFTLGCAAARKRVLHCLQNALAGIGCAGNRIYFPGAVFHHAGNDFARFHKKAGGFLFGFQNIHGGDLAAFHGHAHFNIAAVAGAGALVFAVFHFNGACLHGFGSAFTRECILHGIQNAARRIGCSGYGVHRPGIAFDHILDYLAGADEIRKGFALGFGNIHCRDRAAFHGHIHFNIAAESRSGSGVNAVCLTQVAEFHDCFGLGFSGQSILHGIFQPVRAESCAGNAIYLPGIGLDHLGQNRACSGKKAIGFAFGIQHIDRGDRTSLHAHAHLNIAAVTCGFSGISTIGLIQLLARNHGRLLGCCSGGLRGGQRGHFGQSRVAHRQRNCHHTGHGCARHKPFPAVPLL